MERGRGPGGDPAALQGAPGRPAPEPPSTCGRVPRRRGGGTEGEGRSQTSRVGWAELPSVSVTWPQAGTPGAQRTRCPGSREHVAAAPACRGGTGWHRPCTSSEHQLCAQDTVSLRAHSLLNVILLSSWSFSSGLDTGGREECICLLPSGNSEHRQAVLLGAEGTQGLSPAVRGRPALESHPRLSEAKACSGHDSPQPSNNAADTGLGIEG